MQDTLLPTHLAELRPDAARPSRPLRVATWLGPRLHSELSMTREAFLGRGMAVLPLGYCKSVLGVGGKKKSSFSVQSTDTSSVQGRTRAHLLLPCFTRSHCLVSKVCDSPVSPKSPGCSAHGTCSPRVSVPRARSHELVITVGVLEICDQCYDSRKAQMMVSIYYQ